MVDTCNKPDHCDCHENPMHRLWPNEGPHVRVFSQQSHGHKRSVSSLSPMRPTTKERMARKQRREDARITPRRSAEAAGKRSQTMGLHAGQVAGREARAGIYHRDGRLGVANPLPGSRYPITDNGGWLWPLRQLVVARPHRQPAWVCPRQCGSDFRARQPDKMRRNTGRVTQIGGLL